MLEQLREQEREAPEAIEQAQSTLTEKVAAVKGGIYWARRSLDITERRRSDCNESRTSARNH